MVRGDFGIFAFRARSGLKTPFLGPQKAVFGPPRARKAEILKSPRTIFSNFVIDLIFQIWGF